MNRQNRWLKFQYFRPVVALTVAAAMMAPAPAIAASGDQADLQTVTRIRQEGFRNSKVMEIQGELTDRLGPRLTGSSNLKRANEWTRDQLTQWGLVNAHLEPFPFGRGWALESVSVRMTAPDVAQLYALPKAWTPATNGVLKGEVVRLEATDKEELEKEDKNKYTGKIVLVGNEREIKPQTEAASRRYDEEKLRQLGDFEIPGQPRTGASGGPGREEMIRRFRFQRELQRWLNDAKVAAAIEPSRGEAGLIFVQGTQAFKQGEPDGVLQLVMSVEHWGRIARLLERKVPVELELDVKSRFENLDDGNAFNTIAEIPGTDKKDEIVMLGGHLDSWHAGTGATDNAAGCAVAMEAVRILQTLGLKPRRTIRIALWGGEEQGLLGSRAYVAKHFGSKEEAKSPASGPDAGLPSYLREPQVTPVNLKPASTKLAAYFNVDNGTGKLRGIYAQENASVVPIFQAWGEPFRDLGFTAVSLRNTGGTDHLPFDAIGLPGFQFIQDPVEYETRTHHSNMDTFERSQREDLMQAAVVLATFVYQAAIRDEMLPRKPFVQGTQVVMLKDDNAPAVADAPAKPAKKDKKAAKGGM
ncbi:MAG TPA: M20/M25/M40 family metallo-hydrolase [Clostridia bacterium]|nr:M20/M25/M40 family metallo-hydrolase [Clostridia bacterium]